MVYDDPVQRDADMACGCVMLLGAAVVGAIVVVTWLEAHQRQVETAVFVACVAVGVYAARGPIFAMFRRAPRPGPQAPPLPTPLAAVKLDEPVHTAGLVGMGTAPTHTPLGGPPCVFYRVDIERVDPPELLFSGRSSDELVLDDGSGVDLHVALDGATWLAKEREVIPSSPEAPDPRVVEFLSSRGLAADFPVLARVHWIAPHELVFVRGVAHEKAPGGDVGYRTSEQRRLEMIAAPDRPVSISLDPIPPEAAPAPTPKTAP